MQVTKQIRQFVVGVHQRAGSGETCEMIFPLREKKKRIVYGGVVQEEMRVRENDVSPDRKGVSVFLEQLVQQGTGAHKLVHGIEDHFAAGEFEVPVLIEEIAAVVFHFVQINRIRTDEQRIQLEDGTAAGQAQVVKLKCLFGHGSGHPIEKLLSFPSFLEPAFLQQFLLRQRSSFLQRVQNLQLDRSVPFFSDQMHHPFCMLLHYYTLRKRNRYGKFARSEESCRSDPLFLSEGHETAGIVTFRAPDPSRRARLRQKRYLQRKNKHPKGTIHAPDGINFVTAG